MVSSPTKPSPLTASQKQKQAKGWGRGIFFLSFLPSSFSFTPTLPSFLLSFFPLFLSF